jgi:crossover junction endodeoxyribonuclease RuvC
MKVMGIDPGSICTGFGIVEEIKGDLHAVHWSSVRCLPKQAFPERLKRIYDELVLAMEKFQPHVVSVEDLFYATNVKTVIKLGQTRGVAILAAVNSGIEVAEYSPLEIKQSVVGYGRADKNQVRDMVSTLLRLKEKPEPFDASDALAAAICHIHNAGLQQKIKQAQG